MADEGASSSSNSIDDQVEERQESQTPLFASSFNSNDNCAAVSSSGHMGGGSQVFLLGKESGNPASNPFAIKTATPTRSVADSTESKESRPLLAPPTLKLGNPETPKIVLRASALSVQAEKLKLVNKHDGSSNNKQEGKENSSDESNIAKVPRLSETNGKISKVELFASGISTTSDATGLSSPSKPTSLVESTFSLGAKNSDDQSSNGGNFIFGQNLHERALNYDNQKDSPSSPTDSHNLTFEEAALQKEELEKMERDNQEGTRVRKAKTREAITEKLKKSLSESAKEYESKQVKRKFDEVTVVTGEEEESNVMQINCKLFAFDKVTMNWQERGRGILRLNDKECRGHLNSRVEVCPIKFGTVYGPSTKLGIMQITKQLRPVNIKLGTGLKVEISFDPTFDDAIVKVMRTQGSLRVVLNTKVWAGMSVEHPSKKTVRLTAYDPQGVKVFLVMAQPKDAEQLFHALDWRVATLKNQEPNQPADNDNNSSERTVEEATSSSSTFNPSWSQEAKSDNCSDDGCFGADSSTETLYVLPQITVASEDGEADSTDVQS